MPTSIQIPKITEFKPIGIGKKHILPYAVKSDNGNTYYDQYFLGIEQIELTQKLYPALKLFVPSSADLGYLFQTTERFWAGTGTVVLRPGRDGYADKRVKQQDGSKLKLSRPVIVEHGISWVIDYGNLENRLSFRDINLLIIDESKLKEYSEIDTVIGRGLQYIQGFDEKDRGVPTKFGNKPKEEYNNAGAWIDLYLLINPIMRCGWSMILREELDEPYYDDGRPRESPDEWLWAFSLGSEVAGDIKQFSRETLLDLRKKVMAIPTLSINEIPIYVKDLDKEIKQLEDLQSE